jgi:diacylglycerol kinase (ATP)
LREAGFSVRTVLGEDADDALRRAGGRPLGVVAVGTGNDFARALGPPVQDPGAAGRPAAEVLKGGEIREVDLGRVGQKWFGNRPRVRVRLAGQ